MNARLHKLATLLCLLPLLALTQAAAHAQTVNADGIPLPPAYTANTSARYNIEIENGVLSVDPLKNRVDSKALWGNGNISSVPATIGNLTKFLRAVDTNLNIVLSPGTAEQTISDLKLRSGDMKALVEAVGIATGNKVRGSQLNGKDNWTFMTQQKQSSGRTVEVFNLSGYIQTLSTNDIDLITRKLDELQLLIRETLQSSGYTSAGDTVFRYHPGTHLMIVTGSPDAIDITRKIVNALSSQPGPEKEILDLISRKKQD
jgi:hypothetical protein